MRHRRVLAFGALVLGLSSVGGAQDTRPSVSLPGFRGLIRLDTVGTAVEYEHPPEQVLEVLKAAFVDIGVQPDVDASKGYVGKFDIRAQRRFAGAQMSSFLDC